MMSRHVRTGTYSIVAHDPATGELGVAVQSHWFSVGSVVSWARPGVGAAATQSVAEIAHGPGTLERLQEGMGPADAIASVLAGDPLALYRQVGAVDAHGAAAAHTGAGCIAHAGHELGDGFACQANMMATDTVPTSMSAAFRAAGGDLAERLLAALDAGESAGGDVRGRQSAALVVVPGTGEAWRRRYDVRVEDHRDPLPELRRLLRLARAYEMADLADQRLAEGAGEEAATLYACAAQLAPECAELSFWAGLGIAGGDLDAGAALVRRAVADSDSWLVLLDRLGPDLAPTAASVRERLGR
jgi:uncharacterized Ntn-hydrolase superfamily protein